jgi:hypothetical protein
LGIGACFWAITGVAEQLQPRVAVLGKTVNYRQAADGHLTRLNYHFFAEIFLPSELHGASGRLTDPSGRAKDFQGTEGLLAINGSTDFTSLAALGSQFPDGTYKIHFEAPQAKAVNGKIVLRATQKALADPVHITLTQGGKPVAADAVDPAKDLAIVWSPFRQGHADPNGILDDLIFVHVGDCTGKVIARSPAPYAADPVLTYRAESYNIPANTLRSGMTYQVSVEHAPLVTSKLGDVPALATYPSTTFVDFHTAVVSADPQCPATPYRMDNGQSDRMPAPAAAAAATGAQVRFFVLVKSSNYSQSTDGALTLLNYHFFSEIFPAAGVAVSGNLTTPGATVAKPYEPHDATLYVEGGHFKTLSDLDAAYPNGQYRVSLQGSGVNVSGAPLNLSGPQGKTDLPAPIHISVEQDGHSISPDRIVATKPVTLRWSAFSNGRSDPNHIVDDMIFVVLQDCHGQRIFHTGLPFDGPYMHHDVREVQLDANLLHPGQPYSMFVEMPHVADSIRAGDTPGFASYATATYLDLKTVGDLQAVGKSSAACPASMPAMDTGQTDRPPAASQSSSGPITDQVTFLYYEDLAAPRQFYQQVLGLKPYYDTEWVSLYHTAPGASIGLVKLDHTNSSPPQRRAAVMVSIVTSDVAAWYRKLQHNPQARIVKPLYDHPAVPIRAFEMEDPSGYPVEIFQWLTPPALQQ